MDLFGLEQILIQTPLVGVFVWFAVYVLNKFTKAIKENNEQWRQFLVERNGKSDAILDKMTKQLEANTRVILRHDATVRGVNPEVTGDYSEMKDILKDI